LFVSIFQRCYFAGHANKKRLQKLEADLQQIMLSEPVTQQLMAYQDMTDFLLFYAKIFQDVVIRYSQDEDLQLLKNDFQLLILKYKPLIDKLADERCNLSHHAESDCADMIQQIFENLLRKHEKILKQYDPSMNFRNYVWKIIKNECASHLQTQNRYHERFGGLSPDSIGIAETEVLNDDLEFGEMFRVFDHILEAYTTSKYKLVVCLKVLLLLKISLNDLQRLFKDEKTGYNAGELEAKLRHLNSGGENLRGIFARMRQISPVINLAENSHTDGQSYWRWTNQQISHLVHFLNKTHGMNFDREVLKILAEKYFENYYDM
jgi:RNA polymerase sigma factor (sigma-70 family)